MARTDGRIVLALGASLALPHKTSTARSGWFPFPLYPILRYMNTVLASSEGTMAVKPIMAKGTNNDAGWQAVLAQDRAWDGRLFYGVRSTGIYCRPSCP